MIRTVSISMTVLKAFSDSPERGARKLPAAPANKPSSQSQIVTLSNEVQAKVGPTANHKINPSKLLDSYPHRFLEFIRFPHVRPGGDARVPRGLRQLLGSLSDSVQPAIQSTGQYPIRDVAY